MKNRLYRNSPRGFTLIEILVSIAIIIIIAGILFSVGISIRRSSLERQNKAILTTLDGVLAGFLKSNREPPAVAQPDVSSWVSTLKADPDSAKILAGLTTFNGTAVLDAYGNPIEFLHSHPPTDPKPQPNAFFKSWGPDGLSNTLNSSAPENADDVFSQGVAP